MSEFKWAPEDQEPDTIRGREEPSRKPHWLDEYKVIDGVRYRKYDTGYSIRDFYCHPGPGWDTRWEILREYKVDDARKLPDEPFYEWRTVEDKEK